MFYAKFRSNYQLSVHISGFHLGFSSHVKILNSKQAQQLILIPGLVLWFMQKSQWIIATYESHYPGIIAVAEDRVGDDSQHTDTSSAVDRSGFLSSIEKQQLGV